jgi:hypothetical protein
LRPMPQIGSHMSSSLNYKIFLSWILLTPDFWLLGYLDFSLGPICQPPCRRNVSYLRYTIWFKTLHWFTTGLSLFCRLQYNLYRSKIFKLIE